MSEATHPSIRTSRYMAGMSLIAFPSLLVAAGRLDHLSGSNAERVAAMAKHAGEQATQGMLMYASSLLLIVAVFAIARLTLAATPKVTRTAMTLALVGAGGHIVLATYGLIASFTGRGEPAQMIALLDRLDASPTLMPFIIGIILFGPGMVLLTVALYRAGIVGRVSLGAMLLALALHMGPQVQMVQAIDVPTIILALVFGALGLRVLRTGDAEFAAGRVEPLAGRNARAALEPDASAAAAS